jgi:hypothetical protein
VVTQPLLVCWVEEAAPGVEVGGGEQAGGPQPADPPGEGSQDGPPGDVGQRWWLLAEGGADGHRQQPGPP